MSRRKRTAIGAGRGRLVRGVATPQKRVQDELYRELATLVLRCDGRPGRHCSRVVAKLWCEDRPTCIEQVLESCPAGRYHYYEDNCVFICGDPDCAAESQPVRHDVIVALLAGMVDRGEKRTRMSVNAPSGVRML